MDQDLLDLLSFLTWESRTSRQAVTRQAVKIVLGLSASPEGVAKLSPVFDRLLSALLRLLCAPDEAASEDAAGALVNLSSQDPQVVEALLKLNAIGRVMDYLKEGTCKHPRLLVMLLSNLTTTEAGSSSLLQLDTERLQGLHMAVLLKRLFTSGINYIEGQPDDYEHVASILTNVTRYKAARELLLQPGRGLLQALAAQLRAPSLLRRRGAAGTIRNCCMSAEEDGTLEHIVSDHAVLQVLLGPVSGSEPKESDEVVREAAAETVMALAATEKGRDALWDVKAPELIRKGYELEEHPGVCAALEHAAEYFLSYSKVGPPGGTDQLEPAGPTTEPQPEGQQAATTAVEDSKEQ